MNLVLHASAVLFDSDGVLVDSKAAGEAAWHSWALRHRLDPGHVLADVHGRRSRETVARFQRAAGAGPATAEVDALEIRTVVLEDSAHGIRSARAAGVGAVLGVGDSARGLGCDAVVPDLTSVRWTENGIMLTEAHDTTPEAGERRA